MNTDKLLSIFELILQRDAKDHAVNTHVHSQCFPSQKQPPYTPEQRAVEAAVSEDGPDYMDAPAGFPYPIAINEQPHPHTVIAQETPPMPEKVVSPDLGGEIPKQWLESIDTIVDFVKNDPTALAGIDAMILAWLRIKRYEPKNGDSFDSYNFKTVNEEIGFVVESCLKRGYMYVGRAMFSGMQYRYHNNSYKYEGCFVRKPIVKLQNGVHPPVEAAQPTPNNNA